MPIRMRSGYLIGDMPNENSAYNDFAHQFSNTRLYLWDDLKLPELVRHLKPNDRVLDLGCGNGRLIQLFEGKEIEYVGLDQSEALIAIAREKFFDKEFVIGDMTDLPFGDTSFNHIYCIAAFHHLRTVSQRVTTLKQMYRVLKPGGYAYLLNWNLQGEWAKRKLETGNWKLGTGGSDILVPWKDDVGRVLGERYYHAFTLSELDDLFTDAGLDVQDQWYVKKGERSDMMDGENILSILRKL